ncbi:MAG: aminotransferase class IV [Pseudomonadota bacterium]
MSRTVWIKGDYLPEEQATVSIFDRGLLFADAVYEGLGVLDGQIIDFAKHMARLRRSLREIDLPEPMDQDAFFAGLMELIRRNGMYEGFLYLHITRGAHDRDYLYPKGLTPTIFAFTQAAHAPAAEIRPISLASTPDLRWVRRDIKTTNLLGQVLAKKAAEAAGADEALMLDPEGFVTEGGAVSFFIVAKGRIHTRPLAGDILPGITRSSLLEVAAEMGLAVTDERVSLEQVYAADEAFVTGASSYVEPVGQVDGRTIGSGTVGPVTLALREAYLKAARASFYKAA